MVRGETMLISPVLSCSLNYSRSVYVSVFLCVPVRLHSAVSPRAAARGEACLRRRDYNQIRDYHTPTVSRVTDTAKKLQHRESCDNMKSWTSTARALWEGVSHVDQELLTSEAQGSKRWRTIRSSTET